MDSILSAINNTASSLRNVGLKAAGAAGKAIDTVGNALGNPFPQVQAFGPQGLSGALEAMGADALTPTEQIARVQADPRFTPGTPENTGNPSKYTVPNQPSSSTSTKYGTAEQVQAGDTGWAQQYLADSNAGKVVFDGNLRSKAESILRGPSTETKRQLTGDEVTKMINDVGANGLIDQSALDAIYKKYGGAADSAAAIAKEIEDTARANAEAEYRDTLSALGVQKKEVDTQGKQGKENILKQKDLTLTDLQAKQESESGAIADQAAGFADEVTSQKEVLARNWRDLSLQVQRVMRARGVSESSYASDKETSLMLDFNKGLRQLSKSSTDALQNFSDAVIETNKFYERQKTQLDFDTNKAIQDVDTWVRTKVGDIQAQENTALSNKLTQIRSAISEGNKLKIQTQQAIEDKKAALDTWLVQTNVQFKTAVALAAQNKVGDASAGIKSTWDMVKFANDVLTQGGGSIETNPATNQPAIHGKVVNPKTNQFEDFWYPITSGFAKAYETNQAYKASQAANAGLLTPTVPTSTTTQNPLTQSPFQAILGAIGK